ncbi:putative D-xylose 1-dehydrogenase (NADP(+)) [Pseudocercospora fuligena]|uniref:D-xylose 1-dehydrogenase (NADP(+), D-xylono-1,5-lactone-forming) n=1 Tax=Pseudocercospora fuligena TaxID=685502 RepID=A0A8H6RU11_9PEZI|nr:putative D-xylose 1-dehydrogenase (NADP(+)) [Pseudocercospora fuligena]
MASKPTTCRWAALSLSNIASVFFPDILTAPESSTGISHTLVELSTTGSNERAKTWLADNKIPNSEKVHIHNDWKKMLDEGDFDVVYISTPHPLHYEHVKYALSRKRNVLVEKPATMNAKQYENLANMALKQGVVLMEAMWTRYLPATKYLQEELLPRIGEVRRIYADFSFPIVSEDLSHSSRFLDKSAGAGSLLDQGVYALTWADIGLNGSAEALETTTNQVVHANTMSVPGVAGEVDDITTVVLSKRDSKTNAPQAVAIVTTSMTLPGSSKPAFYQRLQAKKAAPSIRIEATKASVAITFPPIRPQRLEIQWYDSEHLDSEGIEQEEIIEKPVEHGWGMWYQADVIAKSVFASRSAGKGEVIGLKETLRVLAWMDHAREQARIPYDAKLDAV